jgi:hypothetical protein
MGKILKFIPREVNGIKVEQRNADGFINGTAMCVAHGKKINDWLRTNEALNLFLALSHHFGLKINCENSRNLDAAGLSALKYAQIFPKLIISKAGSPETGGGTWLHPDLAIQLAQWCNSTFALQVSFWVREWLTTGKNPVEVDLDKETIAWQQWHDIRVYLKDFLRPELMNAVVEYAVKNKLSPIKLCSQVHDTINERIQGLKSKQITELHGLPLGDLIRDYFDASPLVTYSAINKLAKNAIEDFQIEPIRAVHEACDRFLGKAYEPKPVPIAENLYKQGRRLRQAKIKKHLNEYKQLNIFDDNQAI